jgi:hypothetical protein
MSASLNVQDLNADEELALIALAKLVVRADHDFSTEEAAQLQRVADRLGAERFGKATARAKESFKKSSDVQAFALKLERPAAKKLIYDLLYEVALAGEIVVDEARVLRWLAKSWAIEIDSESLAPKPDA